MYVDECGDRLDLCAVLRMVDEVSLAGLVFGVPVEDVELCAHSQRMASNKDARSIVLEDCLLGAVGLGLELKWRWLAGTSAVLRRRNLLGSP